MNERIKQLEAQCWESRPHPNTQAAMGDRFNTEKFAELIVRECAVIVEDSAWHLPHDYKSVDQAKLVKEYFGVK